MELPRGIIQADRRVPHMDVRPRITTTPSQRELASRILQHYARHATLRADEHARVYGIRSRHFDEVASVAIGAAANARRVLAQRRLHEDPHPIGLQTGVHIPDAIITCVDVLNSLQPSLMPVDLALRHAREEANSVAHEADRLVKMERLPEACPTCGGRGVVAGGGGASLLDEPEPDVSCPRCAGRGV